MSFITEEQKSKAIAFFKRNKLIILSVVVFAIIAMVALLLSQSGVQNKQAQIKPTQSPKEPPLPEATNTPPVTDPGQPVDGFEDTWENSAYLYFSEDYLKGVVFEKKELSDGSTMYTYASDNPKRPDMLVVKDNVVVFKRVLVLDMTVSNYIIGMGKPDYIARGSVFYGPDAVTYIYFKMGFAFVADPKTNVVFEDLSFKPVSPRDYKRAYGEDIIGELSRP